jgi:hypothetical protein
VAIHSLRINRVEYDDVKDTMTLVMTGMAPPIPAGVRDDLWYPSAASFTVSVPVRKGAFEQPSGVYIDPQTQQRYRITYNGTAWSAPVEVDSQGRIKPKDK